MNRRFSDLLAPAAFLVSLVVIATVYGTFAAWRGWFPAPQIGLAHRTLTDLSKNWKNDFALEPTRHLVRPDDSDTPPDPDRGFAVRIEDASASGYTLVTGLSERQDESVHVVRLFDDAGQEIHRWPIRYGQFDPERQPQNVMLHGMEVFEDGSLAVTFDAGNAIARVGACGAPMWVTNGSYHHAITRDGTGQLLTWKGDEIAWIDAETGDELRTLSLTDDIIPARDGEQRAYFDIRTRTPEDADEEMTYLADPFHPNDAEPLRAEMADAFPMFEAGDVLISLRELNLVAVVDPESGALKWWHHGPWIKQHDPDFQPDGTITVFDNGTDTGRSLIRRIDPADDSLSVDFAGSEALPFYTWRRGKHQFLPNGNILLTEAEHGRALEVDPEGRLVWERHMRWDETQNLIITEARNVPADFFRNGPPTCEQAEEIADASGD
ncbi:arylsulfotransferase family protein [Tranquillimonas rosea]|uniref:arylsulfotransferase family protein n=1 Tax=Tranquillimonas rosea TaxID=641238 RepID=UPI003BAC53D5